MNILVNFIVTSQIGGVNIFKQFANKVVMVKVFSSIFKLNGQIGGHLNHSKIICFKVNHSHWANVLDPHMQVNFNYFQSKSLVPSNLPRPSHATILKLFSTNIASPRTSLQTLIYFVNKSNCSY